MARQTEETQYVKVAHVVSVFDVDRQTVINWISRGRLPGSIQPNGKGTPWRIPQVSVERLKVTEPAVSEAGGAEPAVEGEKKTA